MTLPMRVVCVAVLVTACAGHPAPSGTLTPARDRISDEAIAADLELLHAWSTRLARFEVDTTPLRAYQAAKARGWLAFAQEEYTDNDRTKVVDDALEQAQRLIVALEHGDSLAGRSTPLVTRTGRVRPDLWSDAERFKNDPRVPCAMRQVALFEIELLRAGHETTEGASCRAQPHLAVAEALRRDIAGRITRCPFAPAAVTVAPAPPARPAPPPPAATPPLVLPSRPHMALVLQGVKFDEAKFTLLPESHAILDVVAQSLVANPEVRLEVAGHTDSRSPAAYNLWLSEKRAEAVVAYLVERGVSPDRLVARGYGLTRPIATNATAAGRARNRRVELIRLR